MNFRLVFPLIDSIDEYTFENCQTNEEFLCEIVKIYFSSSDIRVKESTLAVYMAYRDHYPKYLSILAKNDILSLNRDIEFASSKIIKLRRIALNALSKVA